MEIAIQVPPDVAHRLEQRWGSLSRRALEILALEAYREGVLTSAEVGRLLGFSSRWETEAFLRSGGARLEYTDADLERDGEAIRHATGL